MTTVSPVRVTLKSYPASRLLKRWSSANTRHRLLWCYAVTLASAVGVLAGVLAARGLPIGSPYVVAILALAAVYTEANVVKISKNVEVSVASVLTIFAAVLFGPVAAMIVSSSGLLVDALRRDGERPVFRWIVWTSSSAFIAGCAGLAVLAVGGPAPAKFLQLATVVVVAATADAVGDIALSPLAAVIRGRASWTELTRMAGAIHVSSLPLYVPLISALAYVYIHISPWAVLLFVAPAFVAQRLSLLYRQQRQTADELRSANARLLAANLSFAGALVATLDARDEYTAGHSAAVAVYARDIAARLGLPRDECERAHVCGLVHDIGKIGLPVGLLEKCGPLTLDERRQMQSHSGIGERILSKLDDYADIAKIVRHHHERVDGNGYPDRLRGEEIPLVSRIIAVADAYNAMTSDRPYRDAMPSQVARMRLASAVGSQFDTAVVAAFEAVLATATEGYRAGTSNEFALNQPQPTLAAVDQVAC